MKLVDDYYVVSTIIKCIELHDFVPSHTISNWVDDIEEYISQLTSEKYSYIFVRVFNKVGKFPEEVTANIDDYNGNSMIKSITKCIAKDYDSILPESRIKRMNMKSGIYRNILSVFYDLLIGKLNISEVDTDLIYDRYDSIISCDDYLIYSYSGNIKGLLNLYLNKINYGNR